MNYDRLLQLGGIDREVPPIPPYISKEGLQQEISALDVSKVEKVDENQLFSDTVPAEQKKEAALLQILMLEQMYGYTTSTIENPEYESLILDSEDRIIAGKRVDGKIELFGTVYE